MYPASPVWRSTGAAGGPASRPDRLPPSAASARPAPPPPVPSPLLLAPAVAARGLQRARLLLPAWRVPHQPGRVPLPPWPARHAGARLPPVHDDSFAPRLRPWPWLRDRPPPAAPSRCAAPPV